MTWHFHVAGTAGDATLAVAGIPVWAHEWIPLDEPAADVTFDGERLRLPLYAIHDGSRAIHVAAGEVTPGVWVFFARTPPALDILWARGDFQRRMKRTTALTIACSVPPIFGALAFVLWRDGAVGPAAFVAGLGALFVGDALLALRGAEPRWPRVWRTLLRLES